jgi:hypothetical protein
VSDKVIVSPNNIMAHIAEYHPELVATLAHRAKWGAKWTTNPLHVLDHHDHYHRGVSGSHHHPYPSF